MYGHEQFGGDPPVTQPVPVAPEPQRDDAPLPLLPLPMPPPPPPPPPVCRPAVLPLMPLLFVPPVSRISRISVSTGVLPTSREKNNCWMTWLDYKEDFVLLLSQKACGLGTAFCSTLTAGDTMRSEGNRSSSLPNRIGWLGYCVRQYSSRAHWDFSCSDSMCATSDKPHASANANGRELILINAGMPKQSSAYRTCLSVLYIQIILFQTNCSHTDVPKNHENNVLHNFHPIPYSNTVSQPAH